MVRSFELLEERSRSPLPPSVSFPGAPPKAPWSPGAPLPFALSRTSVLSLQVPLCSCPVSLFVCLARSVCFSSPGSPFSLWVCSRGRLDPHLPFLCPVPFPLTLDLRRLPQFGARPSPVPEVLGGRTVPNSLGSSPPVAEEHRASGTARLGTSAFSGSVSLCFPGPAVLGKVWQGLPLLAKSLPAWHLRMVSGWDSTFPGEMFRKPHFGLRLRLVLALLEAFQVL